MRSSSDSWCISFQPSSWDSYTSSSTRRASAGSRTSRDDRARHERLTLPRLEARRPPQRGNVFAERERVTAVAEREHLALAPGRNVEHRAHELVRHAVGECPTRTPSDRRWPARSSSARGRRGVRPCASRAPPLRHPGEFLRSRTGSSRRTGVACRSWSSRPKPKRRRSPTGSRSASRPDPGAPEGITFRTVEVREVIASV